MGDFEGGNINVFYRPSQVTNLFTIGDTGDITLSNNIEGQSFRLDKGEKVYIISKTTDLADTIYYKKDRDNEGRQCIGIYTIDHNELIYRSHAFEQGLNIKDSLEKVLLLNDNLIVSVRTSQDDEKLNRYNIGDRTPNLDYYEIEMDSGDWIYLFSGTKGAFSPDGKFLASTFLQRKSPDTRLNV